MNEGKIGIGELVLSMNRNLGLGLTPSNIAAAEVYELYILASLRLNEGHRTLDDLYSTISGEIGDIPLYIAAHSLIQKGLVVGQDPYTDRDLTFHNEFHLLLVEGATAKKADILIDRPEVRYVRELMQREVV